MPDLSDSVFAACPPFLLFAGKGGVGKSTCAAAAAVHLAETGRRTLLFSTDPAHSLGDTLGYPVGPQVGSVPEVAGLWAWEPDSEADLERFKASWREPILQLVAAGTYLNEEEAKVFLDLGLPGIDELMGLQRVADLWRDGAFEHFVWDTAPSGHTLRLLALPEVLEGWIRALAALRQKHRQVWDLLVGAAPDDGADTFLVELKRLVLRVHRILQDPGQSRTVVVTRPEATPVRETWWLVGRLRSAGIPVWGTVVNGVVPQLEHCPHCAGRRATQEHGEELLRHILGVLPWRSILERPGDVRGIDALRRLAREL